jgi:hypothetical protein
MGDVDKKQAQDWLPFVAEAIDRDIDSDDVGLIRAVAYYILTKWAAKETARAEAAGTSPSDAFALWVSEHRDEAIGAIVAVVELVQGIGAGKSIDEIHGERGQA